MDEKIITIIESIVTIFVGIPAIIAIINENKLYSIIFSVIFVFVLLFVILLNIFAKNKKHDCKFYRWLLYKFSYKGKYILKTRETYYEYSDMEHIKHSKKFNVLAKVDGVDTITDRYVYSGSSTCIINAPLRGQKIIDEFQDHGWNFYSIKLKTPLAKNDSKTLEMKMDTINDPNHTAKPFLSTGIYEPTQKLIMQVKFKKGIIPQNPRLHIYKDYVDRNPIINRELTFDTNDCILKYDIEYPIYHYKYLITWDF